MDITWLGKKTYRHTRPTASDMFLVKKKKKWFEEES